MAHRDDEGTSFDPKTWGTTPPKPGDAVPTAAPAKGPGPAASDAATFDPKTWVSASPTPTVPPIAKPAAPAKPAPPAPPAPPAASAPVGSRPPYIAAAALSALLLTGGAAAAYFSRSPTATVAPVSVTPGVPSIVAAPPPVEVVDASRRTLVVASPGDVAATLTSSGIPADAAGFAGRAALAALGAAPGDIRMVIDLVGPDSARRMTRMEATRPDGSGVILTAKPDGSYAQAVQQAQLTTEVQVVRGEMDATSFYNAAVTAGINDTLIESFAKAFSFDFNFATDVHAGDIFEAAFEQKVNPQGEHVGPPTLIYVSLQTSTKSKSLYRFLAPGETEPGWFDGNGRSTVTALMRTPVDGARITSNFGMRFHPVLHYTRLHGGTDFAAPIGTPIYAAAAGVVLSTSPTSCAGNMLILKHDNGWETRYFHLSRYAEGMAPGVRVTQGETVGAVGTTGICTTGPHLHFEVHINGEKVDPMSIDTGTGKTLSGDALTGFRRERDRIDRSRASPVS